MLRSKPASRLFSRLSKINVHLFSPDFRKTWRRDVWVSHVSRQVRNQTCLSSQTRIFLHFLEVEVRCANKRRTRNRLPFSRHKWFAIRLCKSWHSTSQALRAVGDERKKVVLVHIRILCHCASRMRPFAFAGLPSRNCAASARSV